MDSGRRITGGGSGYAALRFLAHAECGMELGSWFLCFPISKHFGVCVFVSVFITAGPITKLFAGGGGGEWTTCAMIDDEPRPVWMSPLITH